MHGASIGFHADVAIQLWHVERVPVVLALHGLHVVRDWVTVFNSRAFDRGVEVLCSKFLPLGDQLWFVLDGSDNVERHRGEAANVFFRFLGDVLEKNIDKAWIYWNGVGVL